MIPTLARRSGFLYRILSVLLPQIGDCAAQTEWSGHGMAATITRFACGVELIVCTDNCEQTIGEKRNIMQALAAGKWTCGIDDDDMIPPDYVSRTLEALKQEPDCVGWRMRRFSDGVQFATGKHSITCGSYHRENLPDGTVSYNRTPNHLNPIRRELALQVKFPDQDYAEDSSFAMGVFPRLKSEVFIDSFMYDYLYRTPLNREVEIE